MHDARVWSRDDTARLIRTPGPLDDKYSRGVVALRTGSSAYPGAAVLGVEAAWRSGAGFVRSCGPVREPVLSRRPETVIGPVADDARVDAWVIGSGTDPRERSPEELSALEQVLAGSAPVVVDAGALDLAGRGTAPQLLTPHAGEFARLRTRLGLHGPAERGIQLAETAAHLRRHVLLKGARTLLCSPDGVVIEVDHTTGWLATAGTGDVLAGVLGALIAANSDAIATGEVDLVEVAAAGAWLHGHAARIAAAVTEQHPGHPIVALDVAVALPRAIADLLS